MQGSNETQTGSTASVIVKPPAGAATASPRTGYGVEELVKKMTDTDASVAMSRQSGSPKATTAPTRPPQPRRAQPVAESPKATEPREQAPRPVDSLAVPGLNNTAVESMVRKLLQLQVPQQQSQSFYVVSLGDEDSKPSLSTFSNIDDLIAALREKIGVPCYLFVFMGTRLQITHGQFKYLQSPLGDIPLFDIPAVAEAAADDGWMGGEAPQEFTDTTIDAVPAETAATAPIDQLAAGASVTTLDFDSSTGDPESVAVF